MADPELERQLRALAAAVDSIAERLGALEAAVTLLQSAASGKPSSPPPPPPPPRVVGRPASGPILRSLKALETARGGPASGEAAASAGVSGLAQGGNLDLSQPGAGAAAAPAAPGPSFAPTANVSPQEGSRAAAASAFSTPPVARVVSPSGRPPSLPASPGAPAAPPRPARNWEQIIGTRWMLIAGVIILLAAGVYFFRLALGRGWITPMLRLILGTIWGLAMIAAGEWALHRRMRLFAAGLMGVGIGWMYQTTYTASTNGLFANLHVIGSPTAFAWMCVVTLLGMALSVQTRMLTMAVISLAGALATPLLLSTGENRETLLMCYLLAVDAGFLVLAYARKWQALAPLALVGTAVVFGLWFAKHYFAEEAAPMAMTLAFAWALAGVHAAWCLAARRAGRADRHLASAVLLLAAAMLAVLLTLTCDESRHRHTFDLQLLALAAGTMALALREKYRIVLALAFLASLAMMFAWSLSYPAPWAVPADCFYLWCLAAMGLAVIFLPFCHDWTEARTVLLVAGPAALVARWLCMERDLAPLAMALQLLALDGIVLGICLWRRWHWQRIAPLIWTGLALLLQYLLWTPDGGRELGLSADTARDLLWFSTFWAWVFFALFLGDILLRAWWRASLTLELLDAGLACVATGAMFAGTYFLLNTRYHDWMGLYAALLAGGIVGIVLALHHLAGRKVLASAFLVQALAILALAAPIQWDLSDVTIAWTCQGVAAMLLASWLGNKIIQIDSLLVLAAALVHFLAVDLPTDGWLTQTSEIWGTTVPVSAWIAVMLTAGLLLSAGILRFGKPVRSDADDRALAIALVLAGMVLYACRTAIDLPRLTATWWWWVLAVALGAAALESRSRWLVGFACSLLALATAKWFIADTTAAFLADPDLPLRTLVMNWQFLAGAALAAALLACGRLLSLRGLAMPPELATAFFLLGVLTVGWAVSFEIRRFFHGPTSPSWIDPALGTQTGLSLWWAAYATDILVLGFLWARRPLRYLAMALLGAVIVKVGFVDLPMARIDVVYRVLVLLGLGLLLMGGSLLYHRQMRAKA